MIENGINVERIRSMAASRLEVEYGTPGNLLIVSVGRLAQEKGYDILVRALKKLRERVPATLVIVGDGPEMNPLQQLTWELDLNRWVSFLGHMENPFPVVAKADLFVSSSRYEGYGLALLEAMSLGVPVVATRSGGVPGLISDGVDGFLSPKMTPDSLVETIQSALNNRDVLAKVGARGSILARSRDWSHMWRRHASIYREVCR